MTRTAELLGTPCYMSPEQAARNRSPRLRISGLGVILRVVDRPGPFEASRP
jgi:hypothetical protein